MTSASYANAFSRSRASARVGGLSDRESVGGQRLGHERTQIGLIIDDQDRGLRSGTVVMAVRTPGGSGKPVATGESGSESLIV